MPKIKMKKNKKTSESKEKKVAHNNSKKAYKSTQSDIPIRELYKGMVVLKAKPFNRYVKIMEIAPISYALKTVGEQNNIYYQFSKIFNVCPRKIQFITLSLPSNLKRQLEILDGEIQAEKNENCIEVSNNYKQKLIKSQQDGVQHRFFIVFEYDGKNTSNLEAIYNEMATIENGIANALTKCGNTVLSFGNNYAEINTAISEILYTFYNRNEAFEEPFEERLMKELNLYSDYYGTDDYYMPLVDIIAPRNISYFNSKYIVTNSNKKKNKVGTYYSFLYIPSNEMPNPVTPGWITSLLPNGQGFDVSVYFEREETSKLIGKFRRNLTYTEANGSYASNNSALADTSANSYEAGLYLKNGMTSGQKFFYMAMLFTVSGDSPEEVDEKVAFLKTIFKNNNIRLKECRYQEEICFNSALPFCELHKEIWDKAKQNVLTEGAASIYPFNDTVLNDPDGIYFGDNTMSNSLAVVDLFDTSKFQNPNVFICGMTGFGKTYSLSLMAIRMRIKHIPVYILTPVKSHEFVRLCNALGGQFIEIGAGSPKRINVMEIFKKDEDASSAIDGTDDRISYLSEKAETLRNFFKLLVTNPNMSTEEETLLDKAIIETYRRCGITSDNESLYDPEDFMHQKFRKMPIISDLVKVLREDQKCERIATIIATLCEGSASSFNGQTNVDLSNDFTVISLEHLKGKMLPLGIYMAMDFCWSKIKEDRTKKKMLFIDEWWKLAYNPVAAEYSLEIAKLIRAYGGGMVIATQEMDDVLAVEDGKYGVGVLSACRSKIILHLDKNPARTVQRMIGINDTEVQNIINAGRGEALFIANGNNVRIKFVASELEHKLITTDRKELDEIAKENQQVDEMSLEDFEVSNTSEDDLAEFLIGNEE